MYPCMRLCIAFVHRSVPTSETPHPLFFTPHPSDFDGLEAAPSAPSVVNVARGVARNVVRNVARGVARNVGRMRQYDYLTGAGSPPFFTSVITCP